MTRRHHLAGLVTFIVLLAACSGGPGTSASATATPSAASPSGSSATSPTAGSSGTPVEIPSLSAAPSAEPSEDAVVEFLEERGIRYTTWDGWYRLDEHEKSLGAAWSGQHGPVVGKDGNEAPRLRVKVVDKESMTAISRAEPAAASS